MANLDLSLASALSNPSGTNNIVLGTWDQIKENWLSLNSKYSSYSTIRISGSASGLGITVGDLSSNWLIINKISTNGFSLAVDASSANSSQLTFLSSKISKVASISELTITNSQSVTELTNLLSKTVAAHALVIADGMSTSQLAVVANKYSNVASISGTLVLTTSNLNETQIGNLLSKTVSDATVNVDASNMTTAELTKISDNISKVTAISSLTLTKAQTVDQIAALLSKSSDATVNATSMSAAQLAEVADATDNVLAIIGTLAMSHGTLSAAQMGYLLAKSSGATVNINAASMTSDELSAVANNINNVDSISKLAISSSVGLVDLLSKASAATVIATGLSDGDLSAISSNISKIASNGITGTLNITSTLDETVIGNILSKTATAATVNVDATDLLSSVFITLSNNISKIDSISNLALTSAQNATVITNLLTKASTVSVDAGSMDAGQLAAIATKAAAISTITGTLAISTNGLNETQITTLLSKASASANVEINADLMTTAELAAVSNGIGKVDIISNLSIDKSQTSTQINNLLSKVDTDIDSASVNATNMTAAQLVSVAANASKIDALSGTLSITTTGLNETNIADFLQLAIDTGSNALTVNINASAMTAAELNAVAGRIYDAWDLAGCNVNVSGFKATSALSTNTIGSILDFATASTVDATGMDANRLSAIANALDNSWNSIVENGITGTLNLTSNLGDWKIGYLLDDRTSADAKVNVNADVMDEYQLANVIYGIGKVDSITNLALTQQLVWNTADWWWNTSHVDGVISNLLSKATNATIDVTDMNNSELIAIANNITHIASNGITGDLYLNQNLSSSQLAVLLGSKTSSGAWIEVNASSMSTEQLSAISANSSKIDDLYNLSLTNNQTVAEIGRLLAKDTDYDGADVTIDSMTVAQINALDNNKIANIHGAVTGLTGSALTALANKAVDITDASLTGDLSITHDVGASQIVTLLNKAAPAANVTVDATGMSSAQLHQVATHLSLIDTAGLLNYDPASFPTDATFTAGDKALISDWSMTIVNATYLSNHGGGADLSSTTDNLNNDSLEFHISVGDNQAVVAAHDNELIDITIDSNSEINTFSASGAQADQSIDIHVGANTFTTTDFYVGDVAHHSTVVVDGSGDVDLGNYTFYAGDNSSVLDASNLTGDLTVNFQQGYGTPNYTNISVTGGSGNDSISTYQWGVTLTTVYGGDAGRYNLSASYDGGIGNYIITLTDTALANNVGEDQLIGVSTIKFGDTPYSVVIDDDGNYDWGTDTAYNEIIVGKAGFNADNWNGYNGSGGSDVFYGHAYNYFDGNDDQSDTFIAVDGLVEIWNFSSVSASQTPVADKVVIRSTATAQIAVSDTWVATSSDINDGVANLIYNSDMDVHAAGGAHGWSLDASFNQWEGGSERAVTLVGSAHNDTITGAGFADTITGGQGYDVLTGAAGNDTFMFAGTDAVIADGDFVSFATTSSIAPEAGDNYKADVITDLSDGDSIDLFAYGLNATAASGELTDGKYKFVYGAYNTETGLFTVGDQSTPESNGSVIVLFDSDTAVGTVEVSGIVVQNVALGVALRISDGILTLPLAGVNYIDGTSGIDTISNGTSGNDSISAGDGNDIITGSEGNDTIFGGAGVDTVNYTLTGNLGTDTSHGFNSADTATGINLDSVEIVNIIVNNDTTLGFISDYDHIENQYVQHINIALNNANLTIDDTSNYPLDTNDNASAVVTITGTGDVNLGHWDATYDASSTIDASALTGALTVFDVSWGGDLIKGGSGNNHILGSGGADTIIGGSGNDILGGDVGADIVTGGAGIDSFVFGDWDARLVMNNPDPVAYPNQYTGSDIYNPVLGNTYLADVITDFTADDEMDLSAASLTGSVTGSDAVIDGKYKIVRGSYSADTGLFTVGDQTTNDPTNSSAMVLFDDDATDGLDAAAIVLKDIAFGQSFSLTAGKLTFTPVAPTEVALVASFSSSGFTGDTTWTGTEGTNDSLKVTMTDATSLDLANGGTITGIEKFEVVAPATSTDSYSGSPSFGIDLNSINFNSVTIDFPSDTNFYNVPVTGVVSSSAVTVKDTVPLDTSTRFYGNISFDTFNDASVTIDNTFEQSGASSGSGFITFDHHLSSSTTTINSTLNAKSLANNSELTQKINAGAADSTVNLDVNVSSGSSGSVYANIYQDGTVTTNADINLSSSNYYQLTVSADKSGVGSTKTDVANVTLDSTVSSSAYIDLRDFETINLTTTGSGTNASLGSIKTYHSDNVLAGDSYYVNKIQTVNIVANQNITLTHTEVAQWGDVTVSISGNHNVDLGAFTGVIVDYNDPNATGLIDAHTLTGNLKIKTDGNFTQLLGGHGNDEISLGYATLGQNDLDWNNTIGSVRDITLGEGSDKFILTNIFGITNYDGLSIDNSIIKIEDFGASDIFDARGTTNDNGATYLAGLEASKEFDTTSLDFNGDLKSVLDQIDNDMSNDNSHNWSKFQYSGSTYLFINNGLDPVDGDYNPITNSGIDLGDGLIKLVGFTGMLDNTNFLTMPEPVA